ncbi:MAG TPA: glutamyl-tRNA amidotransferase [Casimicrobiaceae bacterium]|nr:glutamyl-tRNA amidotransferase [Casimicrobiaceae bacterium]
MTNDVLFAVNGTLMRGLALNANLVTAGATFVRDDETDACYRIWSIDDRHPAMLRTPGEGTNVAVEVWQVPVAGLVSILLAEPPGLAVGKVVLRDGSIVLGVLGEPFLCEGKREITEYGGWRAYMASKGRHTT